MQAISLPKLPENKKNVRRCSSTGGQIVISQLDIRSCKDANKNDTCNPYPDNCLLVWCHTIGKNRVDNLYQAELRGSISALDSMQINKGQFIHAIRKGVEMQPLTAPPLQICGCH